MEPEREVKRRNRDVAVCPNGHEYTEENTYIYVTKEGHRERYCRLCRRDRMRVRQNYQGRVYKPRSRP